MKKFILLLVVITLLVPAYAQDIAYAKEVIKKLCSSEMKGRGYVGTGDRLAADYLAAEFERLSVRKFSKSYFQKYTTPVNTFPGKLSLKINGHELIPGKDFLIEPGSAGVSGVFKTVSISAEELLKDEVWTSKVKTAAGKFVVIEAFDKKVFSSDQQKKIAELVNFLKYSNGHPAAGTLVLSTDKLTWSGSTELLSKPSFTVLASEKTTSISSVEANAENKFIKNYETQNVAGFIEGERTDSMLVFTAHYDHLGMMGEDTYFPGANDNASGVAFLLNLVKHYSSKKPVFTTVFIAFSGEEIGLVGSQYFTGHPLFPLEKIKFLINFDLAGTGDGGIQVVNGKQYQSKFDLLTTINTELNLLPQIKIRGEACNSDHCMFHTKGVPCFYMYTLGGIQAYHDIHDQAETLPLTEFEDYFTLVTTFVSRL